MKISKKNVALVVLGFFGVVALVVLVHYYVQVRGSLGPVVGKPIPLPRGEEVKSLENTGDIPVLDDGLGFILPEGFHANIFAEGLTKPRLMALDGQGNLLVADIGAGKVVMLPDNDKNGKSDEAFTVVTGLNNPNSIAFYGGYLYVAETDKISRYAYTEGEVGEKEVIVKDIPADGGHFTRTVLFRGDKMYVSVGSSCNACVEKHPWRATVLEFNPDGSEGRVYASGLRNSVGLALHPITSDMWATDNGRDWLGDGLPPEEVNIVQEGKFYGWPHCYGENVLDPQFGNAEKCGKATSSALAFHAHTAPLGLAFYDAGLFPAEYRGDIFIAEHGSWNSSTPVGYKVIRFDEDNGKYTEKDFMTGFLRDGGAVARPVGVLVGANGEFFVSDDKGGKIFRVTYEE